MVETCRGCAYVREVIVVDDGSTDATGDLAAAAGAKVVRRDPEEGGSKAHAMAAGVAATDADWILFCDADLLGLEPRHLDAICKPTTEGRDLMSIGTFDYGIGNPIVLRLPPLTGERALPRWVFEAIPPERLAGYTIELMINDVVLQHGLPVIARVMDGVFHRTKRDKFGMLEGYRRTWLMFRDLWRLWDKRKWRAHRRYLRSLTIER